MEEYLKYRPSIGLEVHTELKTVTKMFCACKNDPDEKRPNVNICPICLGHPGTLPVINKEAVKHVLRVGLAIGGEVADDSEFDRKNYFYPDIPKGYQISQYKYPLVLGGELDGVKITRVHLEEDTASSSHEGDYSLVDFNRAGVPLMELVTEPVMHSPTEVVKFGHELQLLFQYLEVAEANMEKGEMRLEANISVVKTRTDLKENSQGLSLALGTKVEVKNLNSFKSAERAIEYEIKRQTGVLEDGEKVVQETRGWDDKKQVTYSQRSKEDSHDYRYFPDPDLPKLKLSEVEDFDKKALSDQLKETPNDKRKRFKNDYNIKESDIEFYVYNIEFGKLFEESASLLKDDKDSQLLSNYIVSDVAGLETPVSKIQSKYLAELIEMTAKGLVSSWGAKEVLLEMTKMDLSAKKIAEKMGLYQKSDENELEKVVKMVISNNSSVILEYKNGKISVLQFLIGQGMKETNGSANPQVLKFLFEKLII